MNPLEKLFLKTTDEKRYELLKRFEKIRQFDDRVIRGLGCPLLAEKGEGVPSCRHSGKMGDIIYALPTVAALAGTGEVDFYLDLRTPQFLSRPLAEMLQPLLLKQSYIRRCDIYRNEQIDYDFDLFRQLPINFDAGNISRWLFYLFGVVYDISQPWLTVEADTAFADSIVMARGKLNRNETIHYDFMRNYPRIVFVGLQDEYQEMRQQIPQLTWIAVDDFLQAARIIAGCRFFVGNQTFLYALAEALKVPRIIEVSPQAPNNIPSGGVAYDFFFQRHLECFVKKLYIDTEK